MKAQKTIKTIKLSELSGLPKLIAQKMIEKTGYYQAIIDGELCQVVRDNA